MKKIILLVFVGFFTLPAIAQLKGVVSSFTLDTNTNIITNIIIGNISKASNSDAFDFVKLTEKNPMIFTSQEKRVEVGINNYKYSTDGMLVVGKQKIKVLLIYTIQEDRENFFGELILSNYALKEMGISSKRGRLIISLSSK
jgi:hypothetical protein